MIERPANIHVRHSWRLGNDLWLRGFQGHAVQCECSIGQPVAEILKDPLILALHVDERLDKLGSLCPRDRQQFIGHGRRQPIAESFEQPIEATRQLIRLLFKCRQQLLTKLVLASSQGFLDGGARAFGACRAINSTSRCVSLKEVPVPSTAVSEG